MNVRRARPDDREQLLELWEGSVRATHHFLTESNIIGLRPLVADELASEAIDSGAARRLLAQLAEKTSGGQ